MRRKGHGFAALAAGWIILVTAGESSAQAARQKKMEGKITFITSLNLYVRFSSTGGLAPGDTLYLAGNGRPVPVMVVRYLSSESCSGEIIGKPRLKSGETVYALMVPDAATDKARTPGPEPLVAASRDSRLPAPMVPEVHGDNRAARIYGGVTGNSYSSFSNFSTGNGAQRWYYSLAVNGDNLVNDRISFSSYMNYTYLGGQWKDLTANPFSNLKVYDFALGYHVAGFKAWAGRHINPAISEIGPIDGIQLQSDAGPVVVGAAIGSRPDYYTYGYSPYLFELGGYVSRADTFSGGNVMNTIGLFQQYNRMKTDRRFIYFQNVTNPSSDLSFYLSGEADIFTMKNGTPASDLSLTDMYLSAFYTPINRVSLSLSYSALRNTIYYQTFGISVDSLLLSQNELRHNVMLGATFRPFANSFLRMRGGYSFQQGDVSPTRNINASITQGNIPPFGLAATISYNAIKTGFMSGSLYGISIIKYFSFNSTTLSLGFQKQAYVFGTTTARSTQEQVDMNLNTRLLGRLFLNVYYQGIFSGPTTFGSLMGGFSYRF